MLLGCYEVEVDFARPSSSLSMSRSFCVFVLLRLCSGRARRACLSSPLVCDVALCFFYLFGLLVFALVLVLDTAFSILSSLPVSSRAQYVGMVVVIARTIHVFFFRRTVPDNY